MLKKIIIIVLAISFYLATCYVGLMNALLGAELARIAERLQIMKMVEGKEIDSSVLESIYFSFQVDKCMFSEGIIDNILFRYTLSGFVAENLKEIDDFLAKNKHKITNNYFLEYECAEGNKVGF